MLRCLGVNVDTASAVYGDNLGVIKNATIMYSLWKNKHVEISYHNVHDSVAADIIVRIKIASADNFADCLTKSLPIANHNWLINRLFYGWLALGPRWNPFAFRVCITFGVVYTSPTGWSETRTSLIKRSDRLYRIMGQWASSSMYAHQWASGFLYAYSTGMRIVGSYPIK